MAKVRQEFEFEDGGMLQGLRAMRDLAVSIEKGFDEASEGAEKFSKEVKADMEKSRKALDKVVEGLDNKAKAAEADEKATKKWGNSLKEAANEVNIAGVNVGGLVDKLKAKSAALKSVTSGVTGTSKALRAFKVALASTGIGLLVVALGSLVAYFQRSQKGIDAFNRGMSRVSAAVNVVIDRFATLGGGVKKLFELDFSGAIAEFRKSFKGIGAEISEEASAAGELTGRLQQIRKELVAVNNARSEQSKEIERLKMQSDDTNRSTEERIRLAREAFAMETTGLEKELQLKRENYDLEVQLAKQGAVNGEIRIEEQERLAGLKAEINDLEKGSLTLQTELNNKINSLTSNRAALMEQERAKALALRDAYMDLVDTIEQQLLAQELNKLKSRERLIAERKIALQEIDLLEQKAKAAALAAGEEYTLADNFLKIRENINETYAEQARELAKAENQVNKLGGAYDATAEGITKSLGKIRKVTTDAFGNEVVYYVDAELAESLGEKAVDNIASGMSAGVSKNANLFDEVRSTMMSWLGLDGNEMAILEDAAATTFNTLGQMYTDSINHQLDENQRLIDSLQERESIIQQDLQRELELQEAGRANNVEGKRKELDAIRKEEEKAEKEAAKLRRRQQAAALAANAQQQISNLITSATKIINSNASIPIAGIGIAALAISTMYSLFSQVKAQAQSSVGQRAYKGGPLEDYLGGKRSSGFVKRGGTSDIPGRGNGYRVMDTDLVFGGNEFMMNERESVENEPFLKAMNAGKFRGIDLNAFASSASTDKIKTFNRMTAIRRAGIEKRERARKNQIISSSVERHMMEMNKNLKQLISKTKQYLSIDEYDEGYVEMDGDKTKIIRK